MKLRQFIIILLVALSVLPVLAACDSAEDNQGGSDVNSPPAPGNTNPGEGAGGTDTQGGEVSTPEPGGGVPGGSGEVQEPGVSWTATAAAPDGETAE